MGLLTTRIKLKHKILIAIDISIQDAQRELNKTDGDIISESVLSSSANLGRYLKARYDTFDHLKRQLLANTAKVEPELKRIQAQIDLTTSKR